MEGAPAMWAFLPIILKPGKIGLAGPRYDVRPICPTLPELRHLPHSVCIAVREVVEFGAVFVHVVKFPRPVVLGDEFPLAYTHCPIALVLPEYRGFTAPLLTIGSR